MHHGIFKFHKKMGSLRAELSVNEKLSISILSLATKIITLDLVNYL